MQILVIGDAYTIKPQWFEQWNTHTIHNYVRSDETYTGMRQQYQSAIDQGIEPDMVVVTDHDSNNHGHYIKQQGRFQWIQRNWHSLQYPQGEHAQDLYEQFVSHVRWEREQGEHYRNHKVKKMYQALLNYCEAQHRPYQVLRFHAWSQFVMPGAIDCEDCAEDESAGSTIASRLGI